MKYYIIGMTQNGKKRVIRTASNIKYARKIADEAIEMDMHVSRYTDGYHIVTENLVKEFRGVSIYTDEPFVSKYMAGVKLKAEHIAAIQEYEAR